MNLISLLGYITINHSHRSRWFYQWIWNHHQVYIIINHSHKSRRFYQWTNLELSDTGADDLSMNLISLLGYITINHSHRSRWFCQWIWNHHQVYIIINNSHRSKWFYQWVWNHHQVNKLKRSIIHWGADDSINNQQVYIIICYHECEIVTRCILSIIHTGADDSNNEYEIVIMVIPTVQWLFQ